jgi:Concanavalin A-like lectin/glucanases superfamily
MIIGGGITIGNGITITQELSVITSGLQLYLDAGRAASYSGSGTTWTDLSGNGRNGTLTNGPTYSSADGGSIVFDGTNDFVQCSGSLTVTAATFVTWIRRNGNQGQYDGILFSRGTSITGMDFHLSNQLGYTWNNAVNTYNWQSGLIVPDLTWCMVAVSVTSTAATAYLCQTSGITTATNTVSHASSVLDDIKIAYDDATSRYFAGNIAIAQLYNTALSAEQVSQNFSADRARFGV